MALQLNHHAKIILSVDVSAFHTNFMKSLPCAVIKISQQ